MGRGGSILYASKAFCALMDYTPEELVGEPLTHLIPERFVKRHQKGFDNYLKTGESRLLGKRIRAYALTRDREEVAIELCIRMFRRPDGSDLIIGAMRLADSQEDYVDFSISQMEQELVERHYQPA